MIIVVEGHEKTGKTTFGLSAPKPLKVIEFDVGGVARAVWRFRGEVDMDRDVRTMIPDVARHGGQAEAVLWKEFTGQYRSWLTDDNVRSIMIDSGTLLWSLCHGAYLEELQKNRPDRQSLQPVEYREPNARMRSIISGARQYGKHLIIPHHLREVREDRLQDGKMVSVQTGEHQMSGFKETGYLCDVLIRTSMNMRATSAEDMFVATMTLCGMAGSLAGCRILPTPTIDNLVNMIRMTRGESDEWMP